jgi:hypothetical protein
MRKYKIVFSIHAIDDVEKACEYYNQEQRNLGKRFVKQVATTINSIRLNPYYSGVRYDDVRCAIIKKFPFLIHYTIEEKNKQITIAAVYSTHQEPLWE